LGGSPTSAPLVSRRLVTFFTRCEWLSTATTQLRRRHMKLSAVGHAEVRVIRLSGRSAWVGLILYDTTPTGSALCVRLVRDMRRGAAVARAAGVAKVDYRRRRAKTCVGLIVTAPPPEP
jgi:hypothetical protein